MVRYLYKTGRRRIGFIGGATNADTRGSQRRLGYQQAVRELRLPSGRIIALGKPPISMGHGAKGLDMMLRRWPDTDAVLCVSDLSAFGALAECQRRSRSIAPPSVGGPPKSCSKRSSSANAGKSQNPKQRSSNFESSNVKRHRSQDDSERQLHLHRARSVACEFERFPCSGERYGRRDKRFNVDQTLAHEFEREPELLVEAERSP